MRFRMLGRVAAHNEQGQVTLGSARQRAVLVALLIEPGTPVAIDQLVDRVWGTAPPQRARQTLHTYLSRLRSTLGDAGGPTLSRRSGSYALEVEKPAVDLFQFRALARRARETADDHHAAALWQEAMALWQGRPFADLDSDWLRAVAVGLEAERLAAILDHTDVLLRRGEHARLLPELTAAADAHPLDERLAGQLMLALYRCGRQADALAHYRLLHDRLIDELGSDPGPELRELHQRILRHDPELAAVAASQAPESPASTVADPPREGAAGSPPRPAQLPADVAGFTGRATDLQRLDELLQEAVGERVAPAVVITAIGGTAGVGKTTLAVHWAHQVVARFPDGQLYVNLRGFDPSGPPIAPQEVLRGFLEALAVPPQRVPTSLDAQAALYRSLLAERRMLIVLDNARDSDQIRPLLPGAPGCLVVVTSRNQLTGLVAANGARPLPLDLLSVLEAQELLAHRLGRVRVAAEPEAVHDIITACGRLPLALAIVASHAATHLQQPLTALATQLHDAHARLELLRGDDLATNLRAVFSCSYGALTPEAARLFRLLGLHPGPYISTLAAASLAGIPLARVRPLLAELAYANLVVEHTPDRYTFHDLLRAYAAQVARHDEPDDERHAATGRMLDHYLHTAHTAALLVRPRQPITLSPQRPGVTPEEITDQARALVWFDADYRTLLAAVELASDNGFDTHAWQLAWALDTFLDRRGYWEQAADAQRTALTATQRLGDRHMQAQIHHHLGNSYIQLGRYEDASAHLDLALDLHEQAGDPNGQAWTHHLYCMLNASQGKPDQALSHANQAMRLFQAAGSQTGHAQALNAVGWLHAMMGDYQRTLSHCQQALAVLRGIDDRDTEAATWDSLGYAHHHLGHHERAIECYQLAIDILRDVGDRYFEADTQSRLGETFHAAGDHDAARETWQQALAIFDDIGHSKAGDLRKQLESLI